MSTASASVVSVQPSTATLPSRASTATTMRPGQRTHAASTSAGSLIAAVPSTASRTPSVEQRRAVVERSHPAARLDVDARRSRDARDRRAVVLALGRAACERGVEIDDVNACGAGGGETGRQLPGRAVVHLRALAPPLLQAHGGAVHQIDRRKNQHRGGRSLAALARSARVRLPEKTIVAHRACGAERLISGRDEARSRASPAAWLFSGWNWQANTLSRPTAEQKRRRAGSTARRPPAASGPDSSCARSRSRCLRGPRRRGRRPPPGRAGFGSSPCAGSSGRGRPRSGARAPGGCRGRAPPDSPRCARTAAACRGRSRRTVALRRSRTGPPRAWRRRRGRARPRTPRTRPGPGRPACRRAPPFRRRR